MIVQASPPDSESNASWDGKGLLPRLSAPFSAGPRTKTIHLPSGDQRGCVSRFALVSRTGTSEPAVPTIHSAVSYPSFFSFTVTRTNTT